MVLKLLAVDYMLYNVYSDLSFSTAGRNLAGKTKVPTLFATPNEVESAVPVIHAAPPTTGVATYLAPPTAPPTIVAVVL